jgi:uncharacterized membrane protein (UPF0127 family)
METAKTPETAAAMKSVFRFAWMVGLFVVAFGCEQQSPAGLPVVKMKIGSQTFHLEVAKSDAQQEKGLMKRDSMPDDHGMIFTFPAQRVLSFWMKDTRFPLDIIFLDSDGRVVSIHQMRAYDEDNTSSDFPAKYAIELNRGAASNAGIKVGDVLDIPTIARSP